MKIKAFKGEYDVFNAKHLSIKMYCTHCKQWVEPNKLILGKAHIYGLHCGVMQDVGCVIFSNDKEGF